MITVPTLYRRIAFVLSGLSLLGGCVSIGVPLDTSKNLKGSVANSIYTSPDNRFSVATPYDEVTDHWKYMMVREGDDGKDLQYVIFGPVQGWSNGLLVSDPHTYHVVYLKKTSDKSFSTSYAEKIFQNYNRELEKRHKATSKNVIIQEIEINNHKAVYAIYGLSAPVGKSRLLKSTRHYVYCLINLNGYLANIMVEMAPLDNEQSRTREAGLTSRQFDRFERLIGSFHGYAQ